MTARPWVRHLSASHAGPFVAAGAFEREVSVWNVATAERIAAFDTVLDFGGSRLAIAPDGRHCLAGAYHRHGLAAYAVQTGAVAWSRPDLKRVQGIRISPDGHRAICRFEGRASLILDVATGETLTTLRGVRDVHESPYTDARIVERSSLGLEHAGSRIRTFPRLTFATLAAAFGPDACCVSDGTGPVRCIELAAGRELWRHVPEPGRHVTALAFSEARGGFVGLEWCYERKEPSRLLGFDPTGNAPAVIGSLPRVLEAAFCLAGAFLVLGDGSVTDTSTGMRVRELAFPAATEDSSAGSHR